MCPIDRSRGVGAGFCPGFCAGARPGLRPVRHARFARRARLAGLRLAAIAWALVLVAGTALPAWARSDKLLAYPRDQVWPAAVRFLVVDEHAKITDKDAEAGYVLFELRDGKKPFRGSLEIMTVVRDGRTLVRFVLQIEDQPSWFEIAMLTRLETKLRAELGAPPPPPSAPPTPRPEAPPDPDAPRKDEPRPDGPKADGGPAPAPSGASATLRLSSM